MRFGVVLLCLYEPSWKPKWDFSPCFLEDLSNLLFFLFAFSLQWRAFLIFVISFKKIIHRLNFQIPNFTPKNFTSARIFLHGHCPLERVILQVEKIPPPTIFKIYCENGHKSSPTPIVRVYFDNIGSLNHRTCSLCAPGNFADFSQLFFFEHLFTGQVWECARVRSERQSLTIGRKWFSR